MLTKRRLVVASTVFILASMIGVTAAPAAVSLSCNGFDERSATDKLPRPGVIGTTDFGDGAVTYSEYTIDNDGHLEQVFISSLNDSIPVVATWQNGTNCFGSEISRNAWAVTPNGRIYSDGTSSGPIAGNYGDMGGKPLNRPIVGMSPTSTGNGYWLVASDGGIFSFGDARFHGSTGNIALNRPIVGISVTPTGKGYWMVATDGGIFAFGDAKFYGSTGDLHLNQPIEGMTATRSGHGYWMVASDGGIFAFGDATFHGSLGGQSLSAPIAGMVPNGNGYTLIGEDGQLYPFK